MTARKFTILMGECHCSPWLIGPPERRHRYWAVTIYITLFTAYCAAHSSGGSIVSSVQSCLSSNDSSLAQLQPEASGVFATADGTLTISKAPLLQREGHIADGAQAQ